MKYAPGVHSPYEAWTTCAFDFWKFSKGRTMLSTGSQFSAGLHFWSAKYQWESRQFGFLKANLSRVNSLRLDLGYKIIFTPPLQHTFQVMSENIYCMISYCYCFSGIIHKTTNQRRAGFRHSSLQYCIHSKVKIGSATSFNLQNSLTIASVGIHAKHSVCHSCACIYIMYFE